jgi:hypothetical protein
MRLRSTLRKRNSNLSAATGKHQITQAGKHEIADAQHPDAESECSRHGPDHPEKLWTQRAVSRSARVQIGPRGTARACVVGDSTLAGDDGPHAGPDLLRTALMLRRKLERVAHVRAAPKEGWA